MKMRRAIGFACVLGLTACAAPGPDVLMPHDPSLVWPKPPDAPRVRYLGALTGSDDVRAERSLAERWQEILHGPSEPERLATPHAVAVHANGDRVAIADTNGPCVHVFDFAKRSFERKDRCGADGPALEAPVAVAWMGDTLWIADARLHAVAVLEPDGRGRLIGQDQLQRPAGMAVCAANQLCYVTDAAAHAVLVFDAGGRLVFQFGSHGVAPGQFNFPSQVCCGPDATLWVADSLNFRVQQFRLDGTPIGMFGREGDAAGDLALPKGVAVDPDGNVWVVDARFENVQGFKPDGNLLLTIGREGRGPGEFWLPVGLCIDAKRRMWVADTYNRRVQVFELLQPETVYSGS